MIWAKIKIAKNREYNFTRRLKKWSVFAFVCRGNAVACEHSENVNADVRKVSKDESQVKSTISPQRNLVYYVYLLLIKKMVK